METTTIQINAHIVITEINGYRNIYGHCIFRNWADAKEAADTAANSGKFDDVYITTWALI